MSTLPDAVPAMAYLEPKSKAQWWSYRPKPLSEWDADIIVTHCGICGTDKHMVDNDWKSSVYPLVPGHEVVGRVLRLGTKAHISGLSVGDLVGLGAQCQACHTCSWCIEGKDNLCKKRKFTYQNNVTDETGEHRSWGGFAAYLRTDCRMLFSIPEGIPAPFVGPLMCAGLTVAAPLYEFCQNSWDAKGKRIGIVGLGGLGHLAVQFAAKMGADTVAISRGDGKKSMARSFGAMGFINSQSKEEMKAAAGSFHYLMICVSGGKFPLEQYLPLLRPYGHLHFVGVPANSPSLPVFIMMSQRLTVSSSPIGSSEQMRSMLQFASEKNIRPQIEIFPHSKVNDAMAKVADGSIRFRAVLENDLVGVEGLAVIESLAKKDKKRLMKAKL